MVSARARAAHRAEGAGVTLTLKAEKTSEHTCLSRGMKVRLPCIA